jgi:hypothetical protein
VVEMVLIEMAVRYDSCNNSKPVVVEWEEVVVAGRHNSLKGLEGVGIEGAVEAVVSIGLEEQER